MIMHTDNALLMPALSVALLSSAHDELNSSAIGCYAVDDL